MESKPINTKIDMEYRTLSSAHGDDGNWAKHDNEVKASLGKGVAVLVNTILGSGSLAVAYSFSASGLALGIIVMFCVGLLTLMSLWLLIDCSTVSGNWSYEGLMTDAFGAKYRYIPLVGIALLQFGVVVVYFSFLESLIEHLTQLHHDEVPHEWTTMAAKTLFTMTPCVVVIIPLALMKEITKLDKVSVICLGTLLLVFIHCMLNAIWSWDAKGFDPRDALVYFRSDSEFLVAISILTVAFNCHINFFSTIRELDRATVPRLRILSSCAVFIAFVAYFGIGIFGYLQFFDHSASNILDKYNINKTFTFITVVGMTYNMIVSTPLVWYSCRRAFMELIWPEAEFNRTRWNIVTISGLISAAFLSIVAPDIISVFSVVGGFCAPGVVFILPAAFWLGLFRDQWHERRKTYWLAWFILVFGVIATGCCTYQAIRDEIDPPENHDNPEV